VETREPHLSVNAVHTPKWGARLVDGYDDTTQEHTDPISIGHAAPALLPSVDRFIDEQVSRSYQRESGDPVVPLVWP